MHSILQLHTFEEKYPFLYHFVENGVPMYTVLRDGVNFRLEGGAEQTPVPAEVGKIYPRRIWDSFAKWGQFKKKRTLIFTSSVYRRDKGRNLAAEFLMKKYPDAVVFEWPSRNEVYDNAYFADPQRDKYCPVELYLILYKVYRLLNRKKRSAYEAQCRKKLRAAFDKASAPKNDGERRAIAYLLQELPRACADTRDCHRVFGWLFRDYKNTEYAIDFWGSARENIIPVLPGKPESIELQHGIITAYHTGYIYPAFVKNCNTPFFRRKLLVYGEETKRLLCEESIFSPQQVEVIGNPRIQMYKKQFSLAETKRNLILFTSQPYEQDGVGTEFYSNAIAYLEKIQKLLQTDHAWQGYCLGIKLHPRENNGVRELYEKALPGCTVYDNTSQLFELLNESFLQITATSTTLYEAALFDVPTVILPYNSIDPVENYGFAVWTLDDENVYQRCLNKATHSEYLDYLKERTIVYN